ncbi:hypothetical protein JCM8547_002170 [Rhodosporidiobolus lusitaniae]
MTAQTTRKAKKDGWSRSLRDDDRCTPSPSPPPASFSGPRSTAGTASEHSALEVEEHMWSQLWSLGMSWMEQVDIGQVDEPEGLKFVETPFTIARRIGRDRGKSGKAKEGQKKPVQAVAKPSPPVEGALQKPSTQLEPSPAVSRSSAKPPPRPTPALSTSAKRAQSSPDPPRRPSQLVPRPSRTKPATQPARPFHKPPPPAFQPVTTLTPGGFVVPRTPKKTSPLRTKPSSSVQQEEVETIELLDDEDEQGGDSSGAGSFLDLEAPKTSDTTPTSPAPHPRSDPPNGLTVREDTSSPTPSVPSLSFPPCAQPVKQSPFVTPQNSTGLSVSTATSKTSSTSSSKNRFASSAKPFKTPTFSHPSLSFQEPISSPSPSPTLHHIKSSQPPPHGQASPLLASHRMCGSKSSNESMNTSGSDSFPPAFQQQQHFDLDSPPPAQQPRQPQQQQHSYSLLPPSQAYFHSPSTFHSPATKKLDKFRRRPAASSIGTSPVLPSPSSSTTLSSSPVVGGLLCHNPSPTPPSPPPRRRCKRSPTPPCPAPQPASPSSSSSRFTLPGLALALNPEGPKSRFAFKPAESFSSFQAKRARVADEVEAEQEQEQGKGREKVVLSAAVRSVKPVSLAGGGGAFPTLGKLGGAGRGGRKKPRYGGMAITARREGGEGAGGPAGGESDEARL